MGNINRPYVVFDTEQEVYFRASTLPYVGFENDNDLPSGWYFDIKRWCSLFDLKLPSMPRLFDPSTQGLPEWDFFRSGVGNLKTDLKVLDIYEKFIDHERAWIPSIQNGWYFRWRTDYFYYSDNSYVQYIDTSDNINGRNVVVLEEKLCPSYPVTAASYTRNNDYRVPVYDLRCKQVSSFTGIYINEEEQKTKMSATTTPIWTNVDITKREFIIDTSINGVTRLLFNNNYIERVGPIIPTSLHDFGKGDILGASDGKEWQVFTLKRFPVISSTFSIYEVDTNTETWQEWTKVDTFQDLINAANISPIYAYGSKYYYLDKDLGYVVFGDSESGVPDIGKYIIAMYDVTLRIEYEEAESDLTVDAFNADISPIRQPVNQGFICISHEELDPAKITLRINRDPIAFSNPMTYGPVYVGNDYATLRAEVLSSTGTPVPDTEVEFTVTPSTIGAIGGVSSGVAYSVTNGSGYSYSFYQPPINAEEMGFYASLETAVQGNTLHLDNPSAGLTINDDIYLYKVLKDDPLLGMNMSEYLEENLPDPPWYANPTIYPAAYEKWVEEMKTIFKMAEWTTSPAPNGRKVIVYNWDSSAINPILGNTGAFVPTRPSSIDSNGGVLTYPSGALIPSDPYTVVGYSPYFEDIGAYWVCCTKYIEIQASCWSSFYNRRIYSNIIRVKVQLPKYLLGEYINEQLQKIPFGFKIYQDAANNHAAGLDGATFLTINPHSGPYQVIDMIIDSDGDNISDYFDPYPGQDNSLTGTWVDAPQNGVGFMIQIVI
jgi:hypothetical protein